MVWTRTKCVNVLTVFGSCLTVVGIVLIPLMNYIIKWKIEKAVIIHEGGEVYEYWLDPPVPIYLQIYMFNLTNEQEFLHGDKPSVSQVGPYTYSEKRVKFNVVFNDNGTVSYRQKRIFHFIPDMSVGKETDMFLSPNPVYWALFHALKYEEPKIRQTVNVLTQLFGERPLFTKTMKELIWGYNDSALRIANVLDPTWFYSHFVGYFMNKNNTDDGVYTVFTGSDDISKLGIIDKYNGSSSLSFWATKWANMINGSDGTLGPPYISKDQQTYTFSSDICRSAPGAYTKDVKTSQGINLWRFGGKPSALANASVNPDNIGFCTPTAENCLGSGVFNVSVCNTVDFFTLPAAVSCPHFLYGDPKYIAGVVGMKPIEEEHNTVVDLEPHTGLVLRAYKRLQINIYIEPVANVTETEMIKPVFLPVFWLNESAAIDDKNADKFYSLLLTPLLLIKVTEILLISIGVLLVIGTISYRVWNCRRPTAESLPFAGGVAYYPGGLRNNSYETEEKQPIAIYDEDISNDQRED